MIPGSREGGLRGSNSQVYFSREREAGTNTPRHNQIAMYKGNAFGGFNMTDSLYPRKSNLNDRKHDVLKIAN